MRQLKLADEPCAWCGVPVIGNHRDRELCSRHCFLMRRGWLALMVLLARGADDLVLDREFAALQAREERVRARRGVAAA